MKLTDRLIMVSPWIAGAFILAGIVHFVSVLAMPLLAPNDAFARLAQAGPAGAMALLPPARPGREALPRLDPAFAVGVCRYNLADGPLRVTAAVEADQFTSLSFHSRRGSLYYALTDRAASRRRLDIVVLTAEQLERAEARDNEDEPNQDLRLLAPAGESEGFVLARALAPDASAFPDAQDRVRAIRCAPERE